MAEELAGRINICGDYGLDASPKTYHDVIKARELNMLRGLAIAEARRNLLGEEAEIWDIACRQVLVEAKAQFAENALVAVQLLDEECTALEAALHTHKQELEYTWQASIIDLIKAACLDEYQTQGDTIFATNMQKGRLAAEKNAKQEFPHLFNEALHEAHLRAKAEARNEGIQIKNK
jgi:hypothetical protein